MSNEETLPPPRASTRTFAMPIGRARGLLQLCRFVPFDISTDEGRSKERYRRAVLSSATALAARGIGVVTGLVSVPLTVRYLGSERYGLWATVSSFMVILAFADLGLGNGLINAVSEAEGKDDRFAARVAVSSTFYLLLLIAITLSLLLILAYPFIPWPRIFNVTSPIAKREAGITTALVFAVVLANIPLGLVEKVQMGCQEAFSANLWITLGGVLGFAGLLLSVYLKAGLPWLALSLTGAPLLTTAWNWLLFFRQKRPWLSPSRDLILWPVAKRIAAAGAAFAVLQIFSLLGNWTDNLVIAQLLGAPAVATYAVTQKLFSVTLLAQFVTLPLWPAFGEAQARGDMVWARRALNRSIAATFALGIATAIPLLILGKKIILFWAGPAVVPSWLLLSGFSVWVLVAGYSGTMSAFLSTGLLLGKQIPIYGIASVMALVMKILLVLAWGSAGAIWATVLSYSVLYTLPATFLAYTLRAKAS